ncbi:bro-2 [Spodoptera litura granulovirus]|uniref:Bro-2 n=1 Tax=Spodoptera litura granulovirus TaxID=359919 RepID=A5IZQ5_9BBAC|nr:bro-2 [Spodoptera litura granulovirus]ABQ51996.1 bro-2 [Spodoptera litura granulovirus]
MRSKLPAAEEFQRWLFEEVLPELRKSGKYDMTKRQSVNWAKKYVDVVKSDHKNQLATIRAEHRTELLAYELKLRDVEKCYERQIMEYKQREHEFMLRELKYKTAMEEFQTMANTTLMEFGVNALLARDNIAENEHLRNNIDKVKHRLIPQMDTLPDKEHYTSCFAYVVNGRNRVRVTRNQYNQVEKMDKIMQQFKDPKFTFYKNTKAMEQLQWLDGAEKFLQIKCPNAISLWNKTKELFPHACFGFHFVSSVEIEFLTSDELVNKYRKYIQMCRDNKKSDQDKIESFQALNLIDEADAMRKCFTPSVDGKKRVAQLIEDTHKAVEKEIVPQEDAKRYENFDSIYTPDQIVSKTTTNIVSTTCLLSQNL